MKAAIILIAALAMLSGCASRHNPLGLPGCGKLNTNALYDDITYAYRTDRQWYETTILQLAWQLDCERSLNPPGYAE